MMSEFFRALSQADRDRALRGQPGPKKADHEATADDRTPEPPPAAAGPVEGLDSHFVSLVMPATLEAEQYRVLRHMIEQLHTSALLKIVGVSSPTVGDGKTTTAINLAGALAQAPDARVLLVDADLRRPTVAERLGLDITPSVGLVGAIVDRSLTLSDVVRRRPPFNLDVLPAGDRPVAPYEVLKSPRLRELLEQARERYDYVILDSSPLVSVPDCRVIAQWVDSFLVVVAAHRTPKRLVEEALNVLDPAKILGLLYNRDDRPVTRYDGHAYVSMSTHGNGHSRWRQWRRA
jgi:capsular exopolysaccharide synthesis family protein